jgi:hypothetical protein
VRDAYQAIGSFFVSGQLLETLVSASALVKSLTCWHWLQEFAKAALRDFTTDAASSSKVVITFRTDRGSLQHNVAYYCTLIT